ncbi:WRKY transcription factor 19 [Phytophthora cinnamomi]|uniref:WRKY transcription factor 19 n=1 Tax=Phytophthora cinnamomi TaxID=4785 RepID=UPI00355AADE5|nr:WRKY transcription factor 19 [Phytophthora cinnamomi]
MTSDRGASGGRGGGGGRGDGKRCSTTGCVNKAQSNGKCRTHTGVGQCTHEGCEKQAQYKGLCVAHGGRRVCTHPGCSKTVTSKGKCGDHGGGRRRPSRSRGDADARKSSAKAKGNADEEGQAEGGGSMMSLLLNEWPKEVPGLHEPPFTSAGDWHGYNNDGNRIGYPAQTGYGEAVVPIAPNPVQQSSGSMMSLLLTNGWALEAASHVVEVKAGQDTVQVNGTDSATIKSEGRSQRKRALCSHRDCEKIAQSHGLCVAHGGKRCVHPDCTKSAQLHGLCITHGGSRACSFPGCTKMTRSAGRCFEHGGGKQCSEPGCGKQVQAKGLCSAHGKTKSDQPTSKIVQTLIL